jgi:hypothetical protein
MFQPQKEGFTEDLPNMQNDIVNIKNSDDQVKNILNAIGNNKNKKEDVISKETNMINTMKDMNQEVDFDNLNIAELQDSMNTFLKLKKEAQQINEEFRS